MEEYTAVFDHFMIKCDESKAKEHTIAHYLGGLRLENCNIMDLQPYWTYDNVVQLSLKVEKQ